MNILFVTQEAKDLELHVRNGKYKAMPRFGKDTLTRFQGYVGGYVEAVSLGSLTGIEEFDEIELLLNENGKFQNLPPSLIVLTEDGKTVDYIAGNAIICGADEEGGWVGLDEETIERITDSLYLGLSNVGKVAVIHQKKMQGTH